MHLDLSESKKKPMDSQMLLKVEKLLKLNSKARHINDPLITRAMAEVELAKSNSTLVGS